MSLTYVPSTYEAVLDTGWLKAALSDIGDDDEVVAAQPVGTTKTLAEKLRILVTIEGADGNRETRAYCIKAHLDGSPGLDITPEAMFYRDVAPRLPVRMPEVFFADTDPEAGQAIIVMEDIIVAGGNFGNPNRPYTVEMTRDSLSQLALLHGSTWGGAVAEDFDWIGPRLENFAANYGGDQLQAFLEDGRAHGFAPELQSGENLVEALRRQSEREVTCMLHGDTHTGNAYLDANDRIHWFDWQVVQTGHWSQDVAYHLGTVLSIEDRRANEQDLLRHYLSELDTSGGEPPPWDEAWELYRSGFSYGYLLWVITQVRGRDEVLAHMPRLAAAMTDHDTYRRLGVI